jgi:hypothetical protein
LVVGEAGRILPVGGDKRADTDSHTIPAMQEEAAALIAGLVFAT